MRFFCFILLICSFSVFKLSAQTCSGPGATAQTAQAVCATLSFPQAFIPPCTGVVLPLITGNSCSAGDNLIPTNNSAWYRIHIFQSGTLGFTIAPFSPGADYDWVLFNITNQAPQNVYITNLVVGYNQSATTGPTGCSAVGTVDYNCLG
ncbi:MAG: hypothetical protein LH615_12520, partial [Ferruginibacter sp.]|nr:hypothetical protein [Ferruginibacter sp.]